MRVLITGGAGFIGSNLTKKLLAEGHEVCVLDILAEQVHGADPDVTSPLFRSIKDLVYFVKGSVSDESALSKSLENVDAVVHLAAETGTGQSMYEIKRYVETNVSGTASLLDFIATQPNRVRRIVVASSRAVYGEGKYRKSDGKIVYPRARLQQNLEAGIFDPLCSETGEPLISVATDEDSKVYPASVYGITKLNQEQMVMTVGEAIGIEPVALRYQNVYGPGQSLSNPYTGILSIFSNCIKNGEGLNIFEDGKESRDFVYIDDVVTATYLALTTGDARSEVFGIGSGQSTSVQTVAETLIQLYGSSVPIEISGAFRKGDIRHNFADLTKARKILNFIPSFSFQQGISIFAEWAARQDVYHSRYKDSLYELASRGLLFSGKD